MAEPNSPAADPARPAAPRPKRRRWLRISLRSLMLFVTACCVLLGIVIVPAEKQRRAVQFLKANHVGLDYEMAEERWFGDRREREPFGSIRYWFGPDFVDRISLLSLPGRKSGEAVQNYLPLFSRVKGIWVEHADMTADQLKFLGRLPELRSVYFRDNVVDGARLAWIPEGSKIEALTLRGSSVNETAMVDLARCARLGQLDLSFTSVTGEGLASLTCLHLSSLDLSHSLIHDAALPGLAKFKNMKHLNLSDNEISDDGLGFLAQFPNLVSLDLSKTKVRGAGLAQLTQRSLERLLLSETPIDDAGLSQLGGLFGPYSLDLSGTQVTDEGMIHLARNKGLSTLNLDNTAVGDAGIANLITHGSQVESISLHGTKVTDLGFLQLARLPQLVRVNVENTAVTSAGLKEFERIRGEISVTTTPTKGLFDNPFDFIKP